MFIVHFLCSLFESPNLYDFKYSTDQHLFVFFCLDVFDTTSFLSPPLLTNNSGFIDHNFISYRVLLIPVGNL